MFKPEVFDSASHQPGLDAEASTEKVQDSLNSGRAVPIDTVAQVVGGTTTWRRNLAALWLAQFTAIFGFTFVYPFLPVYLKTDLGVTNSADLAMWTGLVLGAVGVTQAIANPLWGLFGDHFGRKAMVVRAMAAGGLVIVLMGLVRDPVQLLGARLLFGAFAGSVAAANALVVAETPPAEVGRALGIMTSGIALGRTLGPLVGGALAAIVSLRNVFIGSGLVLTVAVLVVILGAHEERRRPPDHDRLSLRHVLAFHGDGRQQLIATMLAVGAIQFAYGAAQGLLIIRLLRSDPSHVQILTGVAFAAGGIAAVIAATTYWRAVRRTGYRLFAVLAGVGLALSVAFLAFAPSTTALIIGTAMLSLAYGAVNPALVSMVGLEAPDAAKGTIMGFNQTAMSLGMALGPIVTGVIAAELGVHAGLMGAAATALAGSLVVLRWTREPHTSTSSGSNLTTNLLSQT